MVSEFDRLNLYWGELKVIYQSKEGNRFFSQVKLDLDFGVVFNCMFVRELF